MRKIIFTVFLLLFFNAVSFGQELLVRHDRYYTEIFLKLDPKTVSSIEKRDGNLVIYFYKNLKKPFKQAFKDRFIQSVGASGNTFTVNLYPDADVSVVNDPDGIKIVTSAKKTNSDILSSYGIGDPLLGRENSPVEDEARKEALDRADRFITEKRFADAAKLLNEILRTTKNDFYRQEAMYRLGQAYLLLAQTNDVYLTDAYQIFDDFASLYPDNFRTPEAMVKSAEAKEKANQLFEAINTYQKIFNTVPDLETKRRALSKIAELHRILGQYEKAVAAYETYLDKFRTGSEGVIADIGQIYFDLKDESTAYEYFSQLNIDAVINDKESSSKKLFSMAKTFEGKQKYPTALKLYQAVYNKFPEAKETNDAIFKSADILRLTGKNNDADMLLLTLKEKYPDKQSGQQASIEYASKYLGAKPSDYWKDYFKDMLSRDDVFGLQSEAKYLIIKSMISENKINEVIPAIDAYFVSYPGSKHFKELDKTREDFTFIKGNDAFKQKDYNMAENIFRKFNADYPESLYKPRSDAILGDIRFGKALTLYNSGNFKETVNEAENFIAQAESPAGTARWIDLLDNASYKYLDMTYNLEDYGTAERGAKEYLINFPKGKNRNAAISIFENSIKVPMMRSYAIDDFRNATNIYDRNADWIGRITSPALKNEITSVAGLSAYKLGAKDGAKKLYNSLQPDTNQYYALLGILSGDKNTTFDTNLFDATTFEYAIGEVKKTDPEFALRLVKLYNKDIKLSARLEYDLAKTASGDVVRGSILTDVYDVLRTNENAKFDGSADVFLDMGAMYFNKNDFKSAVVPLKEFTDQYKTLDDKRAEALYYMGKSFVNMNDAERGFRYFTELTETIPDSVYAGIAKSEMEENTWKRDVTR